MSKKSLLMLPFTKWSLSEWQLGEIDPGVRVKNRYDTSVGRLQSLLDSNLFKENPPLIFGIMDWDISQGENGDWNEMVPYYFRNDFFFSKLFLMTLSCDLFLNRFRMSEFLLRNLRRKIVIKWDKTQNVDKVGFLKNGDQIIGLHVLFSPTARVEIGEDIIEAVNKFKNNLQNDEPSTEIEGMITDIGGILKRGDEIANCYKKEVCNQIRKCSNCERNAICSFLNKVRNTIESFRIESQLINELKTRLIELDPAISNDGLRPELLENFIKNCKVYSSLVRDSGVKEKNEVQEANGVIYIPSIGFRASRREGMDIEVSTGGFHWEYSQSPDDETVLELLALSTIWFREYAILDWANVVKREVKKGGTRAAVSSLMSRSLNHHIGSHALRGLETKISSSYNELEIEAPEILNLPNDKIKNSMGKIKDLLEGNLKLCKYLRQKMEFVTLMGTAPPMWFVSAKWGNIIKQFNEQKLLKETLVESENFHKFDVKDPTPEESKIEVAIPGGHIGFQAIFTIFENIIRDTAKYGTEQVENIKLCTHINDENELYYKIEAWVERGSNKGATENIKEKINAIVEKGIVDEEGKLIGVDLGIKERYICAAYLRGLTMEELPPVGEVKTKPPVLDVFPTTSDNEEFEKIVWMFYLFKPKYVLIVEDAKKGFTANIKEGIDACDWEWVNEATFKNPSALRYKFIVASSSLANQISQIRHYLPYRILYMHEKEIQSIINKDYPNPSLAFYWEWLNRTTKEIKRFSVIHIQTKAKNNRKFSFKEWELDVSNKKISEHTFKEQELDNKLKDSEKLFIIFDSHGYAKDIIFKQEQQRRLSQNVIYYEIDDPGTDIRAILKDLNDTDISSEEWKHSLLLGFVEAALFKLHIVDERLDKKVNEQEELEGIPSRELLKAKGIEVSGSDFVGSKEEIEEEELKDLLKKKNCDFVILHYGIIQKIKEYTIHPDKEKYIEGLIERIRKNSNCREVYIHSARGAIVPSVKTKSIPMAVVERWVGLSTSKLEIIHELLSLKEKKEVFKK